MRLKDVCEINKRTYSVKEKWSVIYYLDTQNINKGQINEVKRYNTEWEKIPSRAKRKVSKNDILYSMVRPNQQHYGIIQSEKENFLVSTGFAVITVNENIADPYFIYYFLTQAQVIEYLQNIAEQSTSTYPAIRPSDIEELAIDLPDLEKQKRIGKFLRSIDETINVKKNINDNLQQQAQALYKSCFVDFDPYDGIMPSDWIIGTVDDLAKEIVCGKTPSTKISEYYGSEIPFITIPDMHGKIYVMTTERYLSMYGANSQPKKTLPKNSICVSCIGTAGLVSLVASESQTNQQINSIIPKDDYSPYYIYLLMRTLSEVINKLGQGGSTIVNLNKAQFGKIQVMIPTVASMRKFDKTVSPLFSVILENQKENIYLSSLRDTLLPRLMSGELDVSDIQL
ncbi:MULTISPECIES: restriction endonuclease subunit S [Megasphaera]|nr:MULTISPECIES: restriction endonuclease subunit S [Megasphaera]